MKISITVYDSAQFLKSGRLKKRAQSQFGRMMVDVEPYTTGAVDSFLQETADKLKQEYESFSSPYIFTHLDARNKATGEAVRIFEECNDLITSPVKLRELLG